MLLTALLACTSGGGVLALTDADNHAVARTLHVPVIEVAEQTDLSVHWDAVVQDLRCQDVAWDNPWMSLPKLDLTAEALLEAVETDALKSADLHGYVEVSLAGEQSPALLSDFSFFDTPVQTDAELLSGMTYLLSLETRDEEDVPARYASMAVLTPSPTSTTAEVHLPDGCGQLTLDVDFSAPLSLARISTITWSDLSQDAIGVPLDTRHLATLHVAHVDGMTAEEVAADYLSLDRLITRSWSVDIEDRVSVDLSELTDFDGVDDSGTWLLGLTSRYGEGYVPELLTVLSE